MATVSWTASDGDWGTSTNWSTTIVPGSGDTAVISTTSATTVTHSSGDTDSVASLTVGAPDTLEITSGGITVASGGSVDGTLVIGGGAFNVGRGGTFVENGDMTVATFFDNGGLLAGSGTLTITGSAILGGAGFEAAQSGSGTTIFTGSTTVEAQFDLAAGRLLVNSGTLISEAQISLSFPFAGSGGATIINAAGGVFDLTYFINDGPDPGQFINSGTLTTSGLGSSATIAIDTNFINAGVVSAITGDLQINGGSSTGALVVAGGAALELSSFTLNEGTSITGSGTLTAGYVIVNGSQTIATSNVLLGVVSGGAGTTLTVTGSATIGGVEVGSGTTVLASTTTFGRNDGTNPSLDLGGGHVLMNNGIFTWLGGTVFMGLGRFGPDPDATIVNAGGAVFDIAANPITNNVSIETFDPPSATSFVNSGTLTTSGFSTTASATFKVDFVNAGVVSAVAGALQFTSGGSATGGFAVASGSEVEFNGGTFTLSSGSTVSGAGTLVVGGGTVVAAGSISISTTISSGARLELASGSVVSGGISFGSVAGGTLQIDGAQMPTTTISGFIPGDAFDLATIPFDSSGSAAVVSSGGIQNQLQISEGGATYVLQLDPAQDFTGSSFHLAADSGSGTLVTEQIACLRRGTRILTAGGEVAVEDLVIGHRVVMLSGRLRPIKWIGRRAYDERCIAGNRTVLPIRVAAGALADGVPRRELWLSPDHAFYVDGVLVAARLLANGATIAQAARIPRLEYFHIELEVHDIIIAEGAPVESYVECDNRGMFHNAAEFARLYPDDRGIRKFCGRRLEEGGPELVAIRKALTARAAAPEFAEAA